MKLVAVELPYRTKAKKQITVEVSALTGDSGVDICVSSENQDHWQPILTLTNEGKMRLCKISDHYGFITNDDKTICTE